MPCEQRDQRDGRHPRLYYYYFMSVGSMALMAGQWVRHYSLGWRDENYGDGDGEVILCSSSSE